MKILLDENKKYYKANLHSHSTRCDGQSTPEEMKKAYKEAGYSVLAYTGHEIMYDYTYLSDDEFIALKGFEQATNNDKSNDPILKHQSAHFNFIAKDPSMDTIATYNYDYDFCHTKEQGDEVKSVYSGFNRLHNTEDFNKVIEKSNELGFLCFYNHPFWSIHTQSDYIGLRGLCGMEVVNGREDPQEHVYDDFLRHGIKLHCLCTDDSHNVIDTGAADSLAFRGFTMLQPDEFTYAGIIDALENGKFYSSQGPEIKSLTLDGNVLKVKTSPVEKILVHGAIRPLEALGNRRGDLIEEAEFVLNDNFSKFFRVVATDKYGKKAFSNAYYDMIPATIKEIKFGKDVLNIKCAPAQKIIVKGLDSTIELDAQTEGHLIEEAEIKLNASCSQFYGIQVIEESGKKVYSRNFYDMDLV